MHNADQTELLSLRLLSKAENVLQRPVQQERALSASGVQNAHETQHEHEHTSLAAVAMYLALTVSEQCNKQALIAAGR